MKHYQTDCAALLTLLCLYFFPLSVRASDVTDQYRFTAFPYIKLASTNWTVFAQLGYNVNPDTRTQTYNMLSPGTYYKVTPWLELWGGLNNRYNQVGGGANTFLFRPYAGPKLFFPNRWNWNLFNFTQYEYRATENLDTHDWSYDQRLRSRFEANAPLTTTDRAWQPRTLYSIASAELFYDFNQNDIIQWRFAAGMGYVVSKRVQLEFIYYAQLGRSEGGPLEHNENIFRFNVKIGLNRKNDAKEAATISSQ